MSKDEAIEVSKIINRGWTWESRIAALIPTLAFMYFAISFYNNSNTMNAQQDRDIRDLNDRCSRVESSLHNKVGMEQFEDFRNDMKTDMRDMKTFIMKNYENK